VTAHRSWRRASPSHGTKRLQTELMEKLPFALPPEPLRQKLTEPLRALTDLWAHNLQECQRSPEIAGL
jgi:hypothetical protein